MGCSLAAAALFTLVLAAGKVSADSPTIYKWVDENGIAHYTTDRERIPRNLRNRLRKLERASSETGQAAADSAAGETPSVDAGTDLWATRDEELVKEEWVEGPSADVSAPPAGEPHRDGGERAALDERIASLEGAVSRDEERLKALITEVDDEGAAPDLFAHPELREIALRLPKLHADLDALRRERAGLDER